MNIAFINAYNELNLNQAMFYSDSHLGVDLFASARLIKQKLNKLGHMIFSPYNFSAAATADVVVFCDRPRGNITHYRDLALTCGRSILMDGELDAWLDTSVDDFKCDIRLTYHPSAWNGQNILPYNCYAVDTQELRKSDPADILARPAGFSLLGTNHFRDFEGELYSLRREAVIYIGQKHADLISLGGRGWDGFPIRSTGPVEKKAEFLRGRQFNFCFENCASVPGYITEKLLEAILCGCIPIYYSIGHDKDLIPPDIYINAAQFESWDALITHCLSLSDAEKIAIVAASKNWLTSENAKMFQLEHAVDTMVRAILG
jgi:hypothetical protein